MGEFCEAEIMKWVDRIQVQYVIYRTFKAFKIHRWPSPPAKVRKAAKACTVHRGEMGTAR